MPFIHSKTTEKLLFPETSRDHSRLILCMKKLFLVSAVLLGVASASYAGVNVSVGIGLPIPLPPAVISRPPPGVGAPQVPVYDPAYPAVVAPPVCAPPVVVVRPPLFFPPRH